MQKQTGPTGNMFVDFILLLFLLFLFYFFGVLKIFFFINLAIYLRSDLNFSFVNNFFFFDKLMTKGKKNRDK